MVRPFPDRENLSSVRMTSSNFMNLRAVAFFTPVTFVISSVERGRCEANSASRTLSLSLSGYTFPMDEKKYRPFWENAEKEAEKDPQIKAMRIALSGLPSLASQAEDQVMDKVKKSRSIF